MSSWKHSQSRCNQSSMAEVYVISHLQWGKQFMEEHKHETQWPSGLCQRIPRKQLSWHGNYKYTSQKYLYPSEHQESYPSDDPSSKCRSFWDLKHRTSYIHMRTIFCPSIKGFCWSIKYTGLDLKTVLWELHSHIIPGNSEMWADEMCRCQMCAWDLFARGETLTSGDPWLGGQSIHGAPLGFWSFSSFTLWLCFPLLDWRQVQNIYSSKLCFRHCNVIPKSTHDCGTSTLCLISQGASSKIVGGSRDESLWMRATLSFGPSTKAVAVLGASTLCLFGDFLQWQGSTGHCTKNTGIILIFYLKISSSKVFLNSW